MIQKSDRNPEAVFEQFVENWFELIATGKWSEAFVQIDINPTHGGEYTPDSFRNEIENEHFCEGTVFRKEHPQTRV